MSGIVKRIAIIGIGNAGSQVALLAEQRCGDLIDTAFINSSDADLAMVNESRSEFKFKIGEGTIEGSGKNRSKTKQYLLADIRKIVFNEEFMDMINDKTYVFVISSTAGGTGSGASPVMLDILRSAFLDVKFIMVQIHPNMETSSVGELGNAREYLDEFYRGLEGVAYMAYDNGTADHPSPTRSLVEINEAIVEDIRLISGCDNFPTKYDSIDEGDFETIIGTEGRIIVVRITKGLTEKIMEDTPIDDIIIRAIKRSKHAEINRDKTCKYWGIITYFTEDVNKLYDARLEKLQDFLGSPKGKRFNHNAVNTNNESMNFLYFIASGLSPINDHVQKMDERVEALKLNLAKSKPGEYVDSSENNSYDTIIEREKFERRDGKENTTMDIIGIFKKYY